MFTIPSSLPRAVMHYFALLLWPILVFTGCLKPEQESKLQKSSPSIRYRDLVFSRYDTLTIRDYRKAKSAFGKDTALNILFFQPSGDTVSKRPLMLFLHGGGFVSGSEYDEGSRAICSEFAKRGYVAVSIGYRYGQNFAGDKTTADSVLSFLETVYMGTQDVRAAIRFLKKNAASARIDTSKVFLFGGSAGAVLALNVAYLDQSEVPVSISNAYGPLDGPFFYDYPFISNKINLVVNLEGAVVDTSMMSKGNVPVMSIYGTEDPLFGYNGYTASPPYVGFMGGQSIHARADHLQILNKLYSFPGEHGFTLSPANTPLTASLIATDIYNFSPLLVATH